MSRERPRILILDFVGCAGPGNPARRTTNTLSTRNLRPLEGRHYENRYRGPPCRHPGAIGRKATGRGQNCVEALLPELGKIGAVRQNWEQSASRMHVQRERIGKFGAIVALGKTNWTVDQPYQRHVRRRIWAVPILETLRFDVNFYRFCRIFSAVGPNQLLSTYACSQFCQST